MHDFDDMRQRAGDARATPKGRPQRIGGGGGGGGGGGASRKRFLGDDETMPSAANHVGSGSDEWAIRSLSARSAPACLHAGAAFH